MALSDTLIRSSKAGAKPIKLFDAGGLFLQVMPSGSRWWRFKYRIHGKEKLLSLGVYPEVSLKAARAKRDDARRQLADGIDPSHARQAIKRERAIAAKNTLEAVAREWHANSVKKWTPNHAEYVLRRLEADIFPHLGHLPIADIKPPLVLAALRKIEKRGAHEIAHRVLQSCGQIFRYAIGAGYAERNPAAELRGILQASVRGHYAAIEAKDLPEFLEALDRNDARLYAQTRYAIRLLMLTFVRTGELIKAKKSEFDIDDAEWRIPKERMKMGKEHIVPLSRQALEILAELMRLSGDDCELLFPHVSDRKKHMSNNTILGALARLGYKGRMTGHGFRALAMSMIKEKLGYRHEVVDRQLAHAPRSNVDAAYDRAKFLDERRKMMQAWADYLDAVAAGNVTTMRRRAA